MKTWILQNSFPSFLFLIRSIPDSKLTSFVFSPLNINSNPNYSIRWNCGRANISIGGQPTNSCTLVWPGETGSWILRPPFTHSSTYSVTKNGRTCPGGDVLWMGSDRDPFVLALSSRIGVDCPCLRPRKETYTFARFL